MPYVSLMVRLSVRGGDDNLICAAADLATRFNAELTGIAAYPALPQMFPAIQIACGAIAASDELTSQYCQTAQLQIDETEKHFRALLQNRVPSLAWRSSVTSRPIARYLAQEARSADLFITNPLGVHAPKDAPRMVNVGEIVMNIGRPVLLVPPEVDKIDLDTVLVGWKDTRATRRAILDSMPLLMNAKQVFVLQIASQDDEAQAKRALGDVTYWLARHGVAAQAMVEPSTGADANRLAAILQEVGAGVLVAGAYGHARIREWALGGVTSDLLMHPKITTLISH